MATASPFKYQGQQSLIIADLVGKCPLKTVNRRDEIRVSGNATASE
jgi:hypothetical protein